MSAGPFLDAFYESQSGRIYPCRAQPESAALVLGGVTNAIPAGPATEEVSARMNGSRRGLGMNARHVRVRFGATPPTGYLANAIVRVPVFQPSVFAQYAKNQTGTYLGASVTCVGTTPEYKN